MLCVHRLGDAGGEQAQLVARRVQHFAAEIEQAADAAAAGLRSDVLAAGEHELEAAAAIRVLADRQGIGLPAQHQRLAAAGEDVDAAGIGRGGDADALRDLLDQLVALVEQVVGRLAAGLSGGDDDALVELRDRLRIARDLVRGLRQPLVELGFEAVELALQVAEALGQRTGGAEQGLARGGAGGIGAEVVEGVVESLQRPAQAGIDVGQPAVDARGQARVGLGAGIGGGIAPQARRHQGVGEPAHGIGGDAGADDAIAARLAGTRRQLHALPRVAFGVDVGDVVAGRVQRLAIGEQAGDADRQ